MKTGVKKVMRRIAAGLLFFCAGFASGYLFDRCGNSINQAGITADVSGYDEAAKRVESAKAAIGDAAGKIREAQREVGISIDDAGNIAGLACGIRDGNVRALDGAGRIEDGIRFIMGILDEAEKRNAAMEEVGNNGVD